DVVVVGVADLGDAVEVDHEALGRLAATELPVVGLSGDRRHRLLRVLTEPAGPPAEGLERREEHGDGEHAEAHQEQSGDHDLLSSGCLAHSSTGTSMSVDAVSSSSCSANSSGSVISSSTPAPMRLSQRAAQ